MKSGWTHIPGNPPPALTRKTFRLELARGPFQGLLEAGWITFGLTIATRVFEAPDFGKALIAAAFAIGHLITPIGLYLMSYSKLRVSSLCALLLLGVTGFLLLAGFSSVFWAFAAGMIFSQILNAQQSTLLIRIHAENYPNKRRGSLLSIVFSVASLAGAIAAVGGGALLDFRMDLYPVIIFVMAGAALAAVLLTYKIPSQPLGEDAHDSPWKNISLAWTDKLFGKLLFAWMLMGLGNLIIIPLRIEYLANPAYGIDATALQIATLTFIIPAVVRILSTSLWGYLFDRTNFIVLRTALNTCFLISVLLFFFTDNMIIMGLGAVFMGLGMGGGHIAWNLWVTKLAPPEKVSAYMSVHTALTGVRGLAAPFLGFALIAWIGPWGVGIFSATLIFLSMVLFLGNISDDRVQKL